MKKNYWFKMEWERWLNDDNLTLCSLETQGFWIKCLCLMYRADVAELTGTIDEIRRKLGCLPEELTRCANELKRTNAANVIFGNGVVTLLSRSRQKELKANELTRLRVERHRAERDGNALVTPLDIDIDIDKEKKEEEQTERAEKKTLLPIDFRPPKEFWIWAETSCPALDLESELEEFSTYWRDIATRNHKRTLRGWNATWKGRMKERQETQRRNGNSKKLGSYGNKRTDADVITESADFYDKYPS
jgi:hypothetical protein